MVSSKTISLADGGNLVVEVGDHLTNLLFNSRYTFILLDEQVALLRAELGAVLEYRKFNKKEGS